MEPHLNTIAIVVSDLPATLQFYRLLGLNIPEGREYEYYVECVSPNASTILFISKRNMLKLNPNWQDNHGKGGIGLHFKFDKVDELEKVYNSLMDTGYKSVLTPCNTKWGERFAEVLDPDGNIVSLFAHLKQVEYHRFPLATICQN